MKLKKLHIQNYKSLVDLEIIEPNPFTVFAGPNGSGKSNIFEALEFMAYNSLLDNYVTESLFGGKDIINFNFPGKGFCIELDFAKFTALFNYSGSHYKVLNLNDYSESNILSEPFEATDFKIDMQKLFFKNHLRFFIKNDSLKRIKYTSNEKILPDGSNLESIAKQILSSKNKEEFTDWISLFVPGFEKIEIHSDNISGKDTLLIYEKGTDKPFTKNLISDGTYNILCLLAAVYQSDEPQFLCIEEPENGLNPYVVETLVSFFRKRCEERGDYIWLNTHSQTLVKELKPHELILVDKVNGATKVKQFSRDHKIYQLSMDEAWLSNALGGGVPW